MKGFAKKGNRKGEKGFTLVELLVVFTLLGVLAAIMIPNITGVIGYGHIQAAATEWDIIQTAMDTMMAKTNSENVTATDSTQDMSAFPSAPYALYPDYLREKNTTGNYSCVLSGKVSQNATGY
jgi:prepilin-type N-terminal cleavage/methylation domain-containing protein